MLVFLLAYQGLRREQFEVDLRSGRSKRRSHRRRAPPVARRGRSARGGRRLVLGADVARHQQLLAGCRQPGCRARRPVPDVHDRDRRRRHALALPGDAGRRRRVHRGVGELHDLRGLRSPTGSGEQAGRWAAIRRGARAVPVGMLVASLSLRLGGVYLALATLAFSLLVEQLVFARRVRQLQCRRRDLRPNLSRHRLQRPHQLLLTARGGVLRGRGPRRQPASCDHRAGARVDAFERAGRGDDRHQRRALAAARLRRELLHRGTGRWPLRGHDRQRHRELVRGAHRDRVARDRRDVGRPIGARCAAGRHPVRGRPQKLSFILVSIVVLVVCGLLAASSCRSASARPVGVATAIGIVAAAYIGTRLLVGVEVPETVAGWRPATCRPCCSVSVRSSSPGSRGVLFDIVNRLRLRQRSTRRHRSRETRRRIKSCEAPA